MSLPVSPLQDVCTVAASARSWLGIGCCAPSPPHQLHRWQLYKISVVTAPGWCRRFCIVNPTSLHCKPLKTAIPLSRSSIGAVASKTLPRRPWTVTNSPFQGCYRLCCFKNVTAVTASRMCLVPGPWPSYQWCALRLQPRWFGTTSWLLLACSRCGGFRRFKLLPLLQESFAAVDTLTLLPLPRLLNMVQVYGHRITWYHSAWTYRFKMITAAPSTIWCGRSCFQECCQCGRFHTVTFADADSSPSLPQENARQPTVPISTWLAPGLSSSTMAAVAASRCCRCRCCCHTPDSRCYRFQPFCSNTSISTSLSLDWCSADWYNCFCIKVVAGHRCDSATSVISCWIFYGRYIACKRFRGADPVETGGLHTLNSHRRPVQVNWLTHAACAGELRK